jgi:Nucleoside 2-deoxyribosyltransferase
MFSVYACGPINGCTDAECKDWRAFLREHVEANVVDPMDRDYRNREMEPGIVREIVELDKADIDRCKVVFVNYVKPSVGTSMEVLYSWERGKYIIVVCSKEAVLSPWLIYHSSCIVHSMQEACDIVNDMVRKEKTMSKKGPNTLSRLGKVFLSLFCKHTYVERQRGYESCCFNGSLHLVVDSQCTKCEMWNRDVNCNTR